jgi:hypothetical protein
VSSWASFAPLRDDQALRRGSREDAEDEDSTEIRLKCLLTLAAKEIDAMRERWVKLGVVFLLFAGIVICVIFSPYLLRQFLEEVGLLRPTIPLAIYDNMVFAGGDEMLSMGTRGYYDDDPRMPHVYVLVDDNQPILLSDFPEALAANMMEDRYDAWAGNAGDTCYSDFKDEMIFRDGKLVCAGFEYPSAFRIGPSETGPFLELPIERQKMIEAFGRPLRWDRRKDVQP